MEVMGQEVGGANTCRPPGTTPRGVPVHLRDLPPESQYGPSQGQDVTPGRTHLTVVRSRNNPYSHPLHLRPSAWPPSRPSYHRTQLWSSLEIASGIQCFSAGTHFFSARTSGDPIFGVQISSYPTANLMTQP